MLGKKTFQPIPSNAVCAIYELLYEKKLISFPVNQEAQGKVDGIVASITSSYFGKELYLTAEEKAVAYLYFIIKGHPFTDGNKRTASLVFEVVCYLNSLEPDYSDFPLDVIAVFIESKQAKDHQKLIKALSDIIFPKS